MTSSGRTFSLEGFPRQVCQPVADAAARLRKELRFRTIAEMGTEARVKTKKASRAALTAPTDMGVLSQLTDANAERVAVVAAEAGVSDQLPDAVPVEAMVSLANLCGSVARELEADGSDESAVDSYTLALGVLAALVVHRPTYRVDKVAFWLMARAAEAVGRVAAERRLSLVEMLSLYDANMNEFRDLLGEGDSSAPRAFAALVHARRALLDGRDTDYAAGVIAEIEVAESELRPRRGNAQQRFDREMRALIREAAAVLEKRPRGKFDWSVR